MSKPRTTSPTMAEQTGFTVDESFGPNGTRGCTCTHCGQHFPRAEGSVMRSHAKREHGIFVTTVTRLAGGKVRVDSPGGAAIYDCTRLDQFGRFPLIHGSSNADRRDCVNAYVASLGCDAFVGFTSDDEFGAERGVPRSCDEPAVILLDGGSETHPACQAHR